MNFLVLEFEDGEQLAELIKTDVTPELINSALEDAPIVYIYPSYQDKKYGLQPAYHLDYLKKYSR